MVLEHLFSENWLEKKAGYAFLLAVIYSSLSIVAARLVFSANSGLVSVMFTSLLLLPYMKKLLLHEERLESKERKFSLKNFWQDNLTAIKVYLAIFLGIYLTYTICAFILPSFGQNIHSLFREQLALDPGVRGQATTAMLSSIFLNNWWVLLACFLVALVAGDGALFFIAWNASSWGTIFGYRAIAATGGAFDSWVNLAIILLITLPHVLLEGGAYMLAAISGSVLSDNVLSKRKSTGLFLVCLLIAVLVFLIISLAFSHANELLLRTMQIMMVLILLYSLSFVFDDIRRQQVFRYTYALFVVAILVFLAGAVVETIVLQHSMLLKTVYMAAFR